MRRRLLPLRGPTPSNLAYLSGVRRCRSSIWKAVSASTLSWPGCPGLGGTGLARHLRRGLSRGSPADDVGDHPADVPDEAVGGRLQSSNGSLWTASATRW